MSKVKNKQKTEQEVEQEVEQVQQVQQEVVKFGDTEGIRSLSQGVFNVCNKISQGSRDDLVAQEYRESLLELHTAVLAELETLGLVEGVEEPAASAEPIEEPVEE